MFLKPIHFYFICIETNLLLLISDLMTFLKILLMMQSNVWVLIINFGNCLLLLLLVGTLSPPPKFALVPICFFLQISPQTTDISSPCFLCDYRFSNCSTLHSHMNNDHRFQFPGQGFTEPRMNNPNSLFTEHDKLIRMPHVGSKMGEPWR